MKEHNFIDPKHHTKVTSVERWMRYSQILLIITMLFTLFVTTRQIITIYVLTTQEHEPISITEAPALDENLDQQCQQAKLCAEKLQNKQSRQRTPLKALQQLLGSANNIVASNIQFKAHKEFAMDGTAHTLEEVTEFISHLNSSPLFSDITLHTLQHTTHKKADIVNFSVRGFYDTL